MLPTLYQWLAGLLLSYTIAFLASPAQRHFDRFIDPTYPDHPPNVLVLTAHPDDECMFFAPTLLALLATTPSPTVYSLCLSVGNADGLGETRRVELGKSLDVLGVPKERRWVIDRPDLQDNFTATWDEAVIADVLQPFVVENQITTDDAVVFIYGFFSIFSDIWLPYVCKPVFRAAVRLLYVSVPPHFKHALPDILTFDHYGISSHPNHISLPAGASHLLSTSAEQLPSRPCIFTLVTVPLYQKYLGLLAPLLAKMPLPTRFSLTLSPSQPNADTEAKVEMRRPIAVSSWSEYARAHRAMRQHWSQLVWFRWLYVSFSRYMWVNEWAELVPPSSVQTASKAEP